MLINDGISVPNNHTLVLDKLALDLEPASGQLGYSELTRLYPSQGRSILVSPEIVLRPLRKPDTYFHYRFDIWINNRKVGILHTNAHDSSNRAIVRLRFENEVFYTEPGWHYYYLHICATFGLSFVKISTMELALDMAGNLLKDLSYIYRHSTWIKQNPEAWFKPAQHSLRCFHGDEQFIFGRGVFQNGSCGKQVTVYNKSKEILHSQKHYITSFHRRNGLDVGATIERVEVRLVRRYLRAFQFGPDELNDTMQLERLFRKALGNALIVVDTREFERDKHRNKRYRRYNLLNLDALNGEPPAMAPASSTRRTKDWLNRVTLKGAVHRYVEMGSGVERDYILHFINSMPIPMGASSWFDLLAKYAESYNGAPTQEAMTRQVNIEHVFRCLTPINNLG